MATSDQPPTLPRAARRAGIVVAASLGAVLVLAVLAGAWIGVRGFFAYGHLRDARVAATAVRDDLTDPVAVSAAIADVSAETAAARALTDDPVWRLGEHVPWVGPQLAAVSTVAASVDDVAGNALTPLADVAATISLDALRPVAGRIDLSTFSAAQDAARQGADGVARAAASVDAIDRTPLVAPLRSAVDDVGELLGQTRDATDALARATVLLPAMLGADGPRDYLVLFQNNAEWRSLGGIPGAVALVHTEDGALSLAAQETSADFPRYPDSVLPLAPEVEEIYGQRPGRWIQNVTQLPDFALAGALARQMWALQHGGQQVDGVIAVDPVSLSYLLQATGPVTLPTGDELSADNAVPLLLNEVYLRYADPAAQDAFFAAAAAAVFDALSQGRADPAMLLEALTRAGDERRLLLWSAHPDDQDLLADTTLAGALPTTDENVAQFGVYLNDGTGSKIDFYMNAEASVIWQECTRDADGRATGTAELTVTLTNDAPADAAALPPYITGGGVFGLPPGTARTVGYLYLPEGFVLDSATITGNSGFAEGTHDGRRVLSFSVDLAPGASATALVTASAEAPGAPEVQVVQTPTLTPPTASAVVCGGG